MIANVIWVILAGRWLALEHLITSIALAITIIGIPLALANFKMIGISLVSFGREIVAVDQAAVEGPPLLNGRTGLREQPGAPGRRLTQVVGHYRDRSRGFRGDRRRRFSWGTERAAECEVREDCDGL